MSNEPVNVREWAAKAGRLFTCGRPGRGTFGTNRRSIDDDTIDRWVEGLPSAELVHIVSLLGRKNDGFSEFGYYPFCSTTEAGPKPTFQEWLDQRYGPRFVVHEFPTVDREGIPPAVLRAVKREVLGLIDAGNTIVVVDSAGAERVARVCEACGCEPMLLMRDPPLDDPGSHSGGKG